jgi:hypothetical protein
MSDFENARRWDPSVVLARRVGSGGLDVGAQFDLSVRFAGREKVLRYLVRDFEPPSRVVFESTTASLVSIDTLTFRELPDGCEMTYSAELRFKGVAAVVNPLLALLFRRLGNRARDSLRQIMAEKYDVS